MVNIQPSGRDAECPGSPQVVNIQPSGRDAECPGSPSDDLV